MKVLFYLPEIARYRDRCLAICQAAKGIEKLILLVGLNNCDLPELHGKGISIITAPTDKHWLPASFKFSKIAAKIIKSEKIDIVHDTFGVLWPLFVWKSHFLDTKFISSFYCLNGWRIKNVWQESSFLSLLSNHSTALMYYGWFIEKIIARFADFVVLQAEGLTPRFCQFCSASKEKIKIINNSVDTNFWSPKSAALKNAKNIKLLFVGSSAASRGLFALLQVLHELKQQNIHAALQLAGRIDLHDQQKFNHKLQEFNLTDEVQILGQVERQQIKALLQTANIFIYQSINDGSPRSVLEAAAIGIPIIASRHPGINILDKEEKFIKFTNYGDVSTIVDMIKNYLAKPEKWQTEALAGSKKIAERFNCATIGSQYAKLYQSILQRDSDCV